MKNNWRFDHFGMVVKDLDQAIKYYEGIGIGPFGANTVRTPLDRMVYGRPADDVKNTGKKALFGSIKMEVTQPLAGKSPQMERLKKHGEGIYHIGFFVDDVDRETENLVGQGFKVVSSGKFAEGGGYAFFDTDRVGGVLIELVQEPPDAK